MGIRVQDYLCWHSNPSSANISRRRTFDENTIPHEDSESYLADNNKVVIIGANGTMGAGAGTVFAGAGYSVTMLARSPGKAKEGLTDAQNDARAEAIAERISLGATIATSSERSARRRSCSSRWPKTCR